MSCLVLRRHARDRRLVEAAQPLMERVKKVGRSTVNLSVLEGSHVLFLAQAVDEGSAHALAGREVRIPAHVSASGKVLLAFRTPDAPSDDVLWDRAFKARFTEHSIVDHLGLRRELRITGERGFAIDAREYREDTCCVAAPVLDETGAAVAALSLSGFPAELRGTTISDLGELVARSASEVSSALGYRGPSRWPVCAA
jgi:IclR family acetate operon transcriptional repressor